MSEEYSVGYNEGYQTGRNEAIDELEQENRLLRARNTRLEAEAQSAPVQEPYDVIAGLSEYLAGDPYPPAAPVQEPDCVFVPRGLVGAACAAIKGKRDAPKILEQLRRYTIGDLSATSTAPVQEPVALRDALAGALSSVYVCGRVWHAWSVGTMTEDDFQPAAECDELLDELVSIIATPPAADAAVQEPCSKCHGVGYYDEGHENDDGSMSGGNYVECEKCKPPAAQRQWVGLSDEQKLSLEIQGGKSDVMLAELVEGWLKEKNL